MDLNRLNILTPFPEFKTLYKVYRIDIFNKSYYGYTGKDLKQRLRSHLNEAKCKVTKPLFHCLNLKWKTDPDFIPNIELEYESDNKIHALLTEVKKIWENDNISWGLNATPGGEGPTFHVKDHATPEDIKFIFGKDAPEFYNIFSKNKPFNYTAFNFWLGKINAGVFKKKFFVLPGNEYVPTWEKKWLQKCDLKNRKEKRFRKKYERLIFGPKGRKIVKLEKELFKYFNFTMSEQEKYLKKITNAARAKIRSMFKVIRQKNITEKKLLIFMNSLK